MEATRWSDTRPDRQTLTACTICDKPAAVECRDGFCHLGRRWKIGITWPGSRLGRDAELVVTGPCCATIEDRRDHEDHLLYRGACLGCGFAGPARRDSNAALEDALDHALADWRRVPIVERHHYDASTTQLERWATQVVALYAAHGLDDRYSPANGGVIRTLRRPMGTRSHHSRGFFDVCAGLVTPRPAESAPEQMGLF